MRPLPVHLPPYRRSLYASIVCFYLLPPLEPARRPALRPRQAKLLPILGGFPSAQLERSLPSRAPAGPAPPKSIRLMHVQRQTAPRAPPGGCLGSEKGSVTLWLHWLRGNPGFVLHGLLSIRYTMSIT